ncbi:MAG: hypothetical protein SFU25_05045 [Candidatus Caenarcaniphilales bacterium]|nr:hypothetical protein [Candidatus Caenarcaniphilales bacterium]
MLNKMDKQKQMALMAYLVFFVPLLTKEFKEDEFVKFHVKQGLVVAIIVAASYILGLILHGFLGVTLLMVGILTFIVGLGLGAKNVLDSEMKPLPFIGQFASKFDF